MIKKSKLFGNKTRVTFCLPADAPPGPVSVVGTFNGWEPGTHELKLRKDGTRTVSVPLPPGHYSFRYLASDGIWLDDDNADAVGPHGSELLLQ
jgi:1,4-alpha-glucan branching enzyme